MKVNVGNYTHFTSCRFCNSHNVTKVIDLGYTPLAGGFFKKGTSQKTLDYEKTFPLTVNFCSDCFLLQCDNSISPDTLFKDYFYFSSSIGTLVTHFENTVQEIKSIIPAKKKAFVLEIGSNDGAFIKSLLSNGYKALGVDPASNITRPLIKKGLPIINDYFSENLASKIKTKYGQADCIYSFHTMAHIEDMQSVIRGIKIMLKKDGYLAFEVHYLGDLMKEVQYDMIYHEHQFYYSYLSLKNFFKSFDMEIFDVKHTTMRAGSMMYFVQNKKGGKKKINSRVKNLEIAEIKQKLHKKETYLAFSKYIEGTKKSLLKKLTQLKKQNKKIVGYGASGRGTVIMNYCSLEKNILEYVIDDAPAKQGSFTPGTHHQILPSSRLTEPNKPDYAVLFAWPFVDEVLFRNLGFIQRGGKFIIPLPKVKVVPNEKTKQK